MSGVLAEGTAEQPGQRPLRVLHVVSAMNRGGIETWLMQVFRSQDQARVRNELMTFSAAPGDYDDELRALEVPVWRCPPLGSALAFARCMFGTMRRERFDVVHSHPHQFSGVVLLLARLAGIPGRIAHSHIDTRAPDRSAGLPRRVYLSVMNTLLRLCATEGVAVSAPAAEALFGEGWQRQDRCRVLPLGLDLSAYAPPADAHAERAATRASFGFGPDTLLIGHVGWFIPVKNHTFLLRVFAEVAGRLPEARLLLIGVGELTAEVREQAERLGIINRVVFAGSRGDVPGLLRAMDVFVFPSLAEGLGLALIEAQVSGLPCVLADQLPAESRLPGAVLFPVPLAAGPEAWADAVLQAAATPHHVPETHGVDLAQAVRLLEGRYAHYRH
ncbi:glycosyltransferase (plasmid) [Deinococcus radiomollis]|uniref:glycosyltransferase n=1 Tax=Deinococcus radiomollis TaxID=468916 RepID=UPI003891FCDE